MPFRGLRDGEIVVPANVPNQEPVTCPECGDTMYARGGVKKARHFYHINNSASNSCPATESTGESATHARCVALAVEALKNKFKPQAKRYGAEITLDVSSSGSGNQVRQADALLQFKEENPYFGKGLIIEVQHRHHEKDIKSTTHDYLYKGYSVAWLSSSDFGEEELDYSVVDQAFAKEDGAGYSVRNYSAKRFIDCESYYYGGEHNWGTVPGYVLTCEEDYQICTSRPCTLRRQNNEDREEYVYNPDVTKPDLPLKVLKNTLVGVSTITSFEEPLKQRYQNAVLEKALADRPEIGECPGPKGFHEWQGNPESFWGGAVDVELRACQHCPVHLFTDQRGYPDERTDILFTEKPDPDWNLMELEADPRQCQNRSHEHGFWYEQCPDCGVNNPY
jgi:predicted RNA-binding Zn-ribbon protein involved in translation (DUF1610 family)